MDGLVREDGPLGSAWALLDTGGPVMVILAVMSVAALAVILLKLWQFLASGMDSTRFIEPALDDWRHGRRKEAVERVSAVRSPIARVLSTAMIGRERSHIEESTVREEVSRVAARELESLRSHLRGLEAIGTLSPLLGLLGTVLGMIEAFRQLQAAGSQVDPAILSGGIWEALLTTAAGLAVAIPAVAALHWLERRVDRCRHRMEDAVTQVFTQPALAAAPSPAAAVRLQKASHAT